MWGSKLFCYVKKSSQSPFLRPMAHRAAPISVSIALGHASATAVKATVGGWSTGSSASLTFPLHSHMSSARREGSEYHFTSLWYDSALARTYDLPVVRQTLYHWAITPVFCYVTEIFLTFVLPCTYRTSKLSLKSNAVCILHSSATML